MATITSPTRRCQIVFAPIHRWQTAPVGGLEMRHQRRYIQSRRWIHIVQPGHPQGHAVYCSVRLEIGEKLEDMVERIGAEFVYLDGPRARPSPKDGEWVLVTDRNHPYTR